MSPCAACLRARRRTLLWLAASLLLLPALAGDPAPKSAAVSETPAATAVAPTAPVPTPAAPPAAGTTTTVTTTITTTPLAEPATPASAAPPPAAAPAAEAPVPAPAAATAPPVTAAAPAADPAPLPATPATTKDSATPAATTAALPVVEAPQPATQPATDTAATVALTDPPAAVSIPLNLDPLLLDDTARRLPSARIGRAYRQRFHATGGDPPYPSFQLIGGTLPDGVAVTSKGEIVGTPTATGRWRFRVQVTDSVGNHAQQGYVLHVVAPARRRAPRPKTAPSPQPVPKPTPTATSLVSVPADASPPPAGPTITVYALTTAIIDMIEATAVTPEPEAVAAAAAGASPADVGAAAGAAAGAVAGAAAGAAAAQAATPATPPVPTPTAPAAPVAVATDPDALPPGMSKIGAEQLRQALAPLAGVEFPRREIFLSALDQRLCDYAQQVAKSAADQQDVAAPTPEQWRDLCPRAWQDSTPAMLSGPIAQVPWQALPATLMPSAWRDWLVVRAGSVRPIAPPDQTQWTGTGCNCLVPSSNGLIFSLLPGWHDPKLTAPVDFILYDRLIAFALPFADDGTLLPNPAAPTPSQQDFIRTTHRYGSRIDAAIYREDWTFLSDLTEEQSAQLAQRLARNAVARINTPLAQFDLHWYERVPGLAPDEYLADGLTLYLRGPAPDAAGFANFDRFREELVHTLIRGLRSLPRETALSIVVDGPELIANADATSPEGWSVQRLLDYIEAAAELDPNERGYAQSSDDDSDGARVRLHYLVLMPEPGTQNLRRLRATVDNARGLTSKTRRHVLRKLQPLVSVGARSREAMLDDMNYIVANFGGVALWPQVQADPAVTEQLQRTLRQTLMADVPEENPLCTPVCEWRWPLRAGFFALATVTGLGLLAWLAICRLRRVRHLTWALLAGGLLSLAVGGLLLQCDPGLVELRESNVLLFVLVAAIVIGLLIALLRPKVEAP